MQPRIAVKDREANAISKVCKQNIKCGTIDAHH